MNDSEKTRTQLREEPEAQRRESAAAEDRREGLADRSAEGRPGMAEERLSELSEAVRRQAQEVLGKLSNVVQQTADGVVITDREGVIQYVNPAFEKITGYGREEVVGGKAGIFAPGAPGAEFHRELWETLLAGRTFRAVVEDRKKNGELLYAQHTITPMRDSSGEVRQFVSVWKDITTQKQAEEARQQLEQKLMQAERMAAVGTVASGIVHNLRGHLQCILGFGELLLLEHPDAHPLEQVVEAARQMNQMVEDILAKSRLRKAPESIDLNALLRRELDFLRANRLFKHEVEKDIRLAEGLPCVEGVYTDLSQMFGNLLRNAVDAMYQRSVKRLSVVSAASGEGIAVEVTDTGCGIPAAHLPRLCDPFFTTKSMDEEEGKPLGTGLGLFTVRRLLEACGGKMEVESVVAVGTTFRIWIPLRRAIDGP